MKIELDLPDDVFKFFNIRAIYKDKSIEEDISEYLKKETDILLEVPFKDAIY